MKEYEGVRRGTKFNVGRGIDKDGRGFVQTCKSGEEHLRTSHLIALNDSLLFLEGGSDIFQLELG